LLRLLAWNVPLNDLAENHDALADKPPKFVRSELVEVLLGVHKIDEQVNAPLM
jgi:hypothetical protein